MEGPLRALVVTDRPDTGDRWMAWLEQAGFLTFTCPGPHEVTSCSRLHGEPCPRREMVDVAVVDLRACPAADLRTTESRACTRVPDDGTTVFVSQVDQPPAPGEPRLVAPVTPGLLTEAARKAARRRA